MGSQVSTQIAQADARGTLCGPHLKSPEEITDLPYFPAGTKSLLCKCLTPQIWEQLKNKKDKYGFTFQQAIFSGAKHTESGVGIYAGSHDSYYAFAPLFDRVIQDYHGHGKNDKHKSDMDYKKLNCPKFPADEDAMINSTRIRVGRNFADYPLGSAVTREQRLEIEQKITTALSKMTGDLKGKYYSLGNMTPEDKKQLIEDHFLFKGGDKYLQSAFLEREWPEARGIFHNEKKTFLVWVNEEDQLRIISMQPGSDIREVFERLSRGVSEIEKVSKFAHDDHLGYITSCPSNLGTGLRASVHIKLPKLGNKKEEMEAIANKYYVQIRGIHGEHTETADHIYDISNLRRLGRSEVELVQDMYNGVKAMIKREKEL